MSSSKRLSDEMSCLITERLESERLITERSESLYGVVEVFYSSKTCCVCSEELVGVLSFTDFTESEVKSKYYGDSMYILGCGKCKSYIHLHCALKVNSYCNVCFFMSDCKKCEKYEHVITDAKGDRYCIPCFGSRESCVCQTCFDNSLKRRQEWLEGLMDFYNANKC